MNIRQLRPKKGGHMRLVQKDFSYNINEVSGQNRNIIGNEQSSDFFLPWQIDLCQSAKVTNEKCPSKVYLDWGS